MSGAPKYGQEGESPFLSTKRTVQKIMEQVHALELLPEICTAMDIQRNGHAFTA